LYKLAFASIFSMMSLKYMHVFMFYDGQAF